MSSSDTRLVVGIDAHAVGRRLTGNETYIASLIPALASADPETAYEVFVEGDTRLSDRPNVHHHRLWPSTPLVRIPLTLPWLLRRTRAAVGHVQYVAPPAAPCPLVVMVHDLSYEHHPEWFHPLEAKRMKALIPWSARRAARVLTVSEYSRQDLIRTYGLAPENVVVTPDGVGPEFRPSPDPARVAEVRQRYGLPDRYLLAVGNLRPRKNLSRLLSAYADLRREGRLAGGERLVIVGQTEWRGHEVFRRVRELGLGDEIRLTGYVPGADLPILYGAARIVVYPSLFEGFGLPVLEAMACGTPVITSSVTAMPEVAGDAAVLVDPADVSAIARAINAMLRDDARRAALSAKGLARARLFTWEACARITARVFREVAGRA